MNSLPDHRFYTRPFLYHPLGLFLGGRKEIAVGTCFRGTGCCWNVVLLWFWIISNRSQVTDILKERASPSLLLTSLWRAKFCCWSNQICRLLFNWWVSFQRCCIALICELNEFFLFTLRESRLLILKWCILRAVSLGNTSLATSRFNFSM